MSVELLLILSMLAQFAAAFLAFRLVRLTGRKLAWGLISFAILLMAVRRSISWYHLELGATSPPSLDIYFEFVGLITSLAMLAGIYLIKALFLNFKQSEELLKDANLQLSSLSQEQGLLLDHALDFVYRHDKGGIFTYISPSVKKITGYSPEEWLKHYTTFLTDHPLNKKAEQFTETALATGKAAAPYEVEIFHKNGSRIWIEVNEQPYLLDGQVAGIIGVARDISQRKKDEEEREKLFSELQDAIAKIKTLKGLIPICAWCKKVRDDKGYWTQVEAYITDHTEAEFSHGLCPECFVKVSRQPIKED